LTGCEDDLPAWFDHLEESFSHKEVQFRKFCPPVKPTLRAESPSRKIEGDSAHRVVKPSCPPDPEENVNDSPTI